jgi:hypothetical protein
MGHLPFLSDKPGDLQLKALAMSSCNNLDTVYTLAQFYVLSRRLPDKNYPEWGVISLRKLPVIAVRSIVIYKSAVNSGCEQT